MLTKLCEVELRVLGCLVEKELTTPDYYPLTLNSLVSACNQKTNRDPVVEYDEGTVEKALDELRQKNLVYVFYGSTGRVPKYKHMFPSYYDLGPSEVAVVSVLMLRGAQTAGELNQRTGRLYSFEGLGEINEALDRLMNRDEPVVRRLPRQPGQKEVRFAHLLSEMEADFSAGGDLPSATGSEGSPEKFAGRGSESVRLSELESDVESLRSEMETLREEFEAFKDQFE